MIKLIATDIDGTLIPEGTHEFPTELTRQIEELKKLGILFVAASGRQYKSMKKLFSPITHNVVFVSGNGSYVKCRDREILECVMDRTYLSSLIQRLRELECDGYYFVAESKSMAYIETDCEDFYQMLVENYHYEVTKVKDILEECNGILKISFYHKDKIEAVSQNLQEEWSDKINVLRSGKQWIDFMPYGVDKGNAIKKIQEILGVTREETMAFGDNANDVAMLQNAKYSFAVETAAETVKDAAKYETFSPKEKGVLSTIQQVIEQGGNFNVR